MGIERTRRTPYMFRNTSDFYNFICHYNIVNNQLFISGDICVSFKRKGLIDMLTNIVVFYNSCLIIYSSSFCMLNQTSLCNIKWFVIARQKPFQSCESTDYCGQGGNLGTVCVIKTFLLFSYLSEWK